MTTMKRNELIEKWIRPKSFPCCIRLKLTDVNLNFSKRTRTSSSHRICNFCLKCMKLLCIEIIERNLKLVHKTESVMNRNDTQLRIFITHGVCMFFMTSTEMMKWILNSMQCISESYDWWHDLFESPVWIKLNRKNKVSLLFQRCSHFAFRFYFIHKLYLNSVGLYINVRALDSFIFSGTSNHGTNYSVHFSLT